MHEHIMVELRSGSNEDVLAETLMKLGFADKQCLKILMVELYLMMD